MRLCQDTVAKDHQPGREDECVELPLLLSIQQCATLERAAAAQELTVGQLLRRLIVAYLAAGKASPRAGETTGTGRDPN